MTGVELELFTGIDQHYESGVRGGVAMVSNCEVVVSNPRILDTYDVLHPTMYILYTDCNNLYGAANRNHSSTRISGGSTAKKSIH